VSGKYSTAIGASNDTVCTDCPTGKQVSTTGSPSLASCADCIIGKFNDKTGAANCDYCPEGKYGPTYGAVDATYCTECEFMRTNSEDFKTCICKSMYEVQEGADGDGDTCACSAGLEWKAGDCLPCNPGYFKPEGRAPLDLCRPCSDFVTGSTSTAADVLATSPNDCECPPLHVLQPDKSETSSMLGVCTPCPEGSVSLESGKCICPLLHYLLLDDVSGKGGLGVCTKCPEGALCDAVGFELGNLPLQDGFWRTSNESNEVRIASEHAYAPYTQPC
jgi:hypothetical protein